MELNFMVRGAGHQMLQAKEFRIPAAHTHPYSGTYCLLL